jgi:Domain of unknown function (DUF4062)
MAKLRVFVSSTYYDLRHIRSNMEVFIESMGYDPVLFESGNIPFSHDRPLEYACYSEVNNSHMLVLIIGGRYGSASEKSKDSIPVQDASADAMYKGYNSVTEREYEQARKKGIPIFIFVEKGVRGEYETFKANRDIGTEIRYAHVDNVGVFHLLDNILSQRRNNFVKEFDKFDDIVCWLKEQWAGIFADLLTRDNDSATLTNMSEQISELNNITQLMKKYTETILRGGITPEKAEQFINEQESILERNAKYRKFRSEPLIAHALRHCNNPDFDNKVLENFTNSSSLTNFLEIAKFPASVIADTTSEKPGSIAETDYARLKKLYRDETDSQN